MGDCSYTECRQRLKKETSTTCLIALAVVSDVFLCKNPKGSSVRAGECSMSLRPTRTVYSRFVDTLGSADFRRSCTFAHMLVSPRRVLAVGESLGDPRFRGALSSLGVSIEMVSPLTAQRAIAAGARAPVVVHSSSLHRDAFVRFISEAARSGHGVLLCEGRSNLGLDRILEAAVECTIEVMLFDGDPDPSAFSQVVRVLNEPTVTALLLRRLARRLLALPPRTRRVLTAALFQPEAAAAHGVVRLSGVCRRTAERQLQRAGLCALSPLLRAIAIARCWKDVSENQRDFAASRKGGFGSPRTMRRAFQLVLGASPRHAARILSRDMVAEHLATCCIRSDSHHIEIATVPGIVRI